MSHDNSFNPFYYSAPALPSEEDEILIDPFMDIPSMTDKEERPGDLFRKFDNSGSLSGSTNLNDVRSSRPRAGKLNWAFGGF